MAIRILQYDAAPGAGYDNQAPFGGDFAKVILAGDVTKTIIDGTRFEIDGGAFAGLKATFIGSFTYPGDEIQGTIDKIQFEYGGTVFQQWSNVGWQVSNVEAAGWGNIDSFLSGYSYKFVVHSSSTNALIMGTNQRDLITAQTPDGTGGGVFFGFGGNDIIDLSKLNDSTLVEAGKGADTVIGGRGGDQIRGMSGNDKLSGGAGRDNIDGQKGADRVFGQGGGDYLSGGTGNDRVWGGRGKDEIIDHRGWNFLFGDGGNDDISGRGVLDGGRGDDVLTGRGRLVGGEGNDTLSGSGLFLGDVFDFRLLSNPSKNPKDSFGNDRVTSYDFDYDHIDGVTPDALWFDAGTDVSFRYQSKTGTILLTATVEYVPGVKRVVGTVKFEDDIPEDVSATVIAGLQGDLVFF